MNTSNLGGESETAKRVGGKKSPSTSAPKATKAKTTKKPKTTEVPPEVAAQTIASLAIGLGGQTGVNHAGSLVILLPEWTVVEGKIVKR